MVRDIAGDELLSRYHNVRVMGKADGSIVTDADFAVQNALQQRLAERWPDIILMGEEMSQHEQTACLSEGRFWCLDPLDGTSNFATGLPFFAISLALIESGRVTAGVVYDPIRQECFRAEAGAGAWLNDQPLIVDEPRTEIKRCIASVDLKRLPPALASRLAAQPPYRSQRNFGAVALEWCWLADGRAQLYLHGGQKLWDYAAGKLVFTEAGGCVAPEKNQIPLTLKTVPAIAAGNNQLLKQWVNWLEAAGYQNQES